MKTMLPNPADLKYFLEAYKVCNISRASERLGITQPSLSLSLKRLEEQLGTKLFLRSKGGIHPTTQGHLLAKSAENLLTQWENLMNQTRSSVNTVSGTVRLGCHPSVALYALEPWVRKLLNDYPDLNLELSHDLSRKIAEEIISLKTDIGLIVNPVSHPDLVIRPLINDEVTFWKSKLKKSNSDTLIYDGELQQTQTLIKKLPHQFTRHIKSSNLEVIAHLTKIGVGVGILPGRVAGSDLVKYNSSIKPFKDKLCLVYRGDVPKTKSFMTVIQTILEQLN